MISQRSLIFGGGSARLIFTPVIGLAAFNPLFEHIISSAMQKLETFFPRMHDRGRGGDQQYDTGAR
jgi:hypothetical protein